MTNNLPIPQYPPQPLQYPAASAQPYYVAPVYNAVAPSAPTSLPTTAPTCAPQLPTSMGFTIVQQPAITPYIPIQSVAAPTFQPTNPVTTRPINPVPPKPPTIQQTETITPSIAMAVNSTKSSMIRRHTRQWTREEDDRLREATKILGTQSWQAVAMFVGNGRNQSQCSQRWQRVLDPKIKKSSWTESEDALLLSMVEEYGTQRWMRISNEFGNRSDVQCRYRYYQLTKKKSIDNVSTSSNYQSENMDLNTISPTSPELQESNVSLTMIGTSDNSQIASSYQSEPIMAPRYPIYPPVQPLYMVKNELDDSNQSNAPTPPTEYLDKKEKNKVSLPSISIFLNKDACNQFPNSQLQMFV